MIATARVYIALGSNIEAPLEQVRAGIAALRQLPESQVIRCSSLYRTAPVGIAAQPDFINAVCALDTTLAPVPLMRRLLAIEQAHGRKRGPVRGGPRTLDLDLLLYDDIEMYLPKLTLPHPRLHERAFVLCPLFEIAPALYVPGHGSVAELLERCERRAVVRLSDEAARQSSAL